MAERTRLEVAKVEMRPTREIAAETFAPAGTAYRTVWNRTQQAAAQARRLAPYDTGALRQSIHTRRAADDKPTERVFEVVADVKYAAAQESGFRHWRNGRFIPGYHYMRDALRSIRW